MSTITWLAPAKLNLFLHITGRRADGYHDLQTVFQFIDLADELRFSPRHDGQVQLRTNLPDVPAGDNLVVRAARLLLAETGTNLGVEIDLVKRLPMGAGLGGGSSNAATTLLALNQIWRLGLTREELSTLGLRLGADVPIFINGQASWAEGVGERLTPLQLAEPWYVVVMPPCQVSTRAVFSAPDLTRNSKPITIPDFLSGAGHNDCEPLVCRLYPEVARALSRLSEYGPARMTGSGACVFAAFEDEQHARRVARKIMQEQPPAEHAFVARGMNESPLHRQLQP